MLTGPAFAQCTPDPTAANGTTTCNGTDADGIRVTTRDTTLLVARGATVSNMGAPAIAVDVPRDTFGSYATNTITVQGTVLAAGQNAITVSSGAPYANAYYSTQQAVLTVTAGGSVTGATALALLQSPGNTNGTVSVSVDNAGTLTGTSGTALIANVVSTASGYPTVLASFSSITNRAGGSIVGGIIGLGSLLTNSGRIDGGAGSALDTTVGNGSTFGYASTIANAAGGVIRATSGAATILGGRSSSLNVTNAGAITNGGNGAALSGSLLVVANQAGGQIGSAGTTAIAGNAVTLTNRGTVTGDVTASLGGSTIDSTGGTIAGSVTLGSGNNTLVARYAGTRTLTTGVTGTITATGSRNVERVMFATDTSVTTPIDLNAGFEQLVLAADADVTATLTSGFTTAAPLVVTGLGTVVNQATIALATTAVSDLDYAFGTSAEFRNEGSITALLPANSYASGLTFSNHVFTNSGAVSVNGGTGVSMSYNDMVNSGTITASGTGVNMFDAVLTNGGTIISTAGTGVYMNGNVGYTSSNSGTIRGATTGVTTGIYLTNTGTISSAGTGVSVQPYGYLINGARGVVNGGSGGAVSVSAFNAGVANAGTINGDVNFYGAGSNNGLAYIALTGGVLNGNLLLGGATLVTDLVNTGPGQFAGITGAVTADRSATLIYAVNADTTATLSSGNVGPFATAGYQVGDGAVLTLATPAGQTRAQTLLLSGDGTVDVDAAIAVTDGPALRSTAALNYPGATAPVGALSIINRGALAVTRTTANSNYYGGAVVLNSTDSFTNAGSIAVTDRTTYATAAIFGGASATNAGTITLNGAVGISGAATVTNTGTITQAAGGTMSRGVNAFGTLTNSGTISVAGSAAILGNSYYSGSSYIASRIINTGTIASTAGAAITTEYYAYSPGQIVNDVGGTIAGGGRAIQVRSATLINAGTITGTVDLGYADAANRSYGESSYIAAGGTIAGDLLFGSGNDLLMLTGDSLGVSGTVDGGAGTDIYGRSFATDGTFVIDPVSIRGFEDALVQAVGADTVATTTSTSGFKGDLYVVGNGSVLNQATIAGVLTTALPYSVSNPFGQDPLFPVDQILASVTNGGSVAGGASLTTGAFTNTGSIGTATLARNAVAVDAPTALAFTNDGTITNAGTVTSFGEFAAVELRGQTVVIENRGRIAGGGLAASNGYDETSTAMPTITMRNSGTISAAGTGVALEAFVRANEATGTVSLDNAGTIEASAQGATGAFLANYARGGAARDVTVTLVNSGTIRANGGGLTPPTDPDGYPFMYFGTSPGTAVVAFADSGRVGITNAASGTIEATGGSSSALYAYSAIDLDNAGTIRGGAGTVLAAEDGLSRETGLPYLAGAVQTLGDTADRIVNSGSIIGSIALGSGDDRIENSGRIQGDVFLGTGDDTFLQRASATLVGLVDAGAGTDLLIVDGTGGGAVDGNQFVNFERFSQIGQGSVAYSGTFRFNTLGVMGGTVTVAAGQTLASDGPVTITGFDAADTVVNDGTIFGGISLAAGNDRVVNRGAIGGAVLLGNGDDSYVDGSNNRVDGGVDGGAGTDSYTVSLAGDRQGLQARTGFERLAVEGGGTLGLTLDQPFEATSLTGSGLTVALNGFSIGRVTGSIGVERLTVDGDVASASLGAGDDVLALGATRLAGVYDGGAGGDVLRLTAAGPVTLAGTATGFEQVALTGNALTVAGSLGSADAPLAFGDGAQSVTIGTNGTIAGLVDFGAGDDLFRLAPGGTIAGTVAGGAGADTATLELAGNRTIAGASLTGFETLTTEGRGMLTLIGTHAYDRVTAASDLFVASDGALTTRQLVFGANDQRFTVAGRFGGSVDGGAGADTIAVSGGTASAPVAFADVTGIESLAMTGGYATVSGTTAFGRIDVAGGRLAGLGGSTIAASQVDVRQGATFGSTGTVNGNLSVAGTLDPGTSPGTMTVNGAVSLGATSLTVLELAPAGQDKLVVNGALSIAQGATLQLAPIGALRAGTSYDLVTASGGIAGSFSTVLKPDSLFGFIVQRSDRIQLLGQFLNDASFSPQAARSVAYVNSVLAQQTATSPLFAALPALLTTTGASNPAAFAQLTPEAYASATQVGVENGLALADLARGPGFAANRTEPGGFTFAQAIGSWYKLAADAGEGVSQTRTTSRGLLAGVGYGDRDWSIGAFGGYLDSRQRIDTLGARTGIDGWVGGLQGRYDAGGFGFGASVAYNDGRADTRRALPGAANTIGRYDLNSWVGDASIHYSLTIGDWALRPRAGLTYVQTRRGGLIEAGGPFALAVARDRHVTGFADAGLGFGRAPASTAALRPFATLGARYQLQGRRADALAGYADGPLTLSALGAARTRLVGTVSAGGTYRLTPGLDIFSTVSAQTGRDDHRQAISAGLRFGL
ncbi:autotransporter outer membrane beta-barrel domain-containing protein [Sphingomonas montana]|uniref:autotransporter outer membrane beta-barrel domain-containing protein n=1 Tax=Sphingomonas montana TaxID=1843236 RepID=UPI001F0A9BD4|nr:autotransporter outer membrane beta-barrel domain-containing protein [Sphingomonas montana]